MEMDQQTLVSLAESALEKAKKGGATAAAVNLRKGSGLSVDVRMSDVETLEYHRDQALSITVYHGQRKGSASTGDLSPQALQDTVDAANRIARYTSEDEYAGLADAERMASEIRALDLYHPWELEVDEAIALARDCEQAAFDENPLITNSDGSSLSSYGGVSVYANSHGFTGFSQGTRHSLSCTMVAQENDAMQRDYWYTVSRKSDEMEAAESVGKKAAQRAVKRLHGRQIETTKAPVLYEPTLARGLIGHFTSAIRGDALYRKASFLLDSMGEKIFPDFIQLYEQPFIPGALGSGNYDKEGVALKDKHLVRGGVVESYLLGSYSARKLGLKSTGNAGGTWNLTLQSGDQDFDELLKTMGTGLLVTELMGSSVNGLTGDYSRGASGFWVEDGEIQHPVEEITVAGNLKDMFANIVAVGSDVDYRAGTRTGSILLEEMTIAGT